MPFFLSRRNDKVREIMDQAHCDPELLANTYEQFKHINRLLGGWKWIYNHWLRPVILSSTNRTVTILDIGCGGGDIIAFLNSLARHDQYNVHFTGIDPDPRAIRFATQKEWPVNIQFSRASSTELVQKNQTFDIVLSNHLMHHLTPTELGEIAGDASSLADQLVLFNDIQRSDIGFVSFSLLSPLLFRNSYISADGITSIKRSYTHSELREVLPAHWDIYRKFPFRLLAIHQKGANDDK